MQEPTHAPGWRDRPIRRGPIIGMYDDTAADKLINLCVVASALMAAAVLLGAAYIWAADFMAGHL